MQKKTTCSILYMKNPKLEKEFDSNIDFFFVTACLWRCHLFKRKYTIFWRHKPSRQLSFERIRYLLYLNSGKKIWHRPFQISLFCLLFVCLYLLSLTLSDTRADDRRASSQHNSNKNKKAELITLRQHDRLFSFSISTVTHAFLWISRMAYTTLVVVYVYPKNGILCLYLTFQLCEVCFYVLKNWLRFDWGSVD